MLSWGGKGGGFCKYLELEKGGSLANGPTLYSLIIASTIDCQHLLTMNMQGPANKPTGSVNMEQQQKSLLHFYHD